MKVIACYNIKGGVGKTTTAVNLAYTTASLGDKTLLWDTDLQGSATHLLQAHMDNGKAVKVFKSKKSTVKSFIQPSAYENLDILPADFSLYKLDRTVLDLKKPAKKIEQLLSLNKKKYDWVFIDCPAGYSEFTEALLQVVDVFLIPVIPSPLTLKSMETFKKQLNKHSREKLLVFPFFSMVDRRKQLHREITELHQNGTRGFLHSNIPFSSKVERMAVELAPLLTYDKRSAAAKAYKELWEEVSTNINMHERVKKIKMWS